MGMVYPFSRFSIVAPVISDDKMAESIPNAEKTIER